MAGHAKIMNCIHFKLACIFYYKTTLLELCDDIKDFFTAFVAQFYTFFASVAVSGPDFGLYSTAFSN